MKIQLYFDGKEYLGIRSEDQKLSEIKKTKSRNKVVKVALSRQKTFIQKYYFKNISNFPKSEWKD